MHYFSKFSNAFLRKSKSAFIYHDVRYCNQLVDPVSNVNGGLKTVSDLRLDKRIRKSKRSYSESSVNHQKCHHFLIPPFRISISKIANTLDVKQPKTFLHTKSSNRFKAPPLNLTKNEIKSTPSSYVINIFLNERVPQTGTINICVKGLTSADISLSKLTENIHRNYPLIQKMCEDDINEKDQVLIEENFQNLWKTVFKQSKVYEDYDCGSNIIPEQMDASEMLGSLCEGSNTKKEASTQQCTKQNCEYICEANADKEKCEESVNSCTLSTQKTEFAELCPENDQIFVPYPKISKEKEVCKQKDRLQNEKYSEVKCPCLKRTQIYISSPLALKECNQKISKRLKEKSCPGKKSSERTQIYISSPKVLKECGKVTKLNVKRVCEQRENCSSGESCLRRTQIYVSSPLAVKECQQTKETYTLRKISTPERSYRTKTNPQQSLSRCKKTHIFDVAKRETSNQIKPYPLEESSMSKDKEKQEEEEEEVESRDTIKSKADKTEEYEEDEYKSKSTELENKSKFSTVLTQKELKKIVHEDMLDQVEQIIDKKQNKACIVQDKMEPDAENVSRKDHTLTKTVIQEQLNKCNERIESKNYESHIPIYASNRQQAKVLENPRPLSRRSQQRVNYYNQDAKEQIETVIELAGTPKQETAIGKVVKYCRNFFKDQKDDVEDLNTEKCEDFIDKKNVPKKIPVLQNDTMQYKFYMPPPAKSDLKIADMKTKRQEYRTGCILDTVESGKVFQQRCGVRERILPSSDNKSFTNKYGKFQYATKNNDKQKGSCQIRKDSQPNNKTKSKDIGPFMKTPCCSAAKIADSCQNHQPFKAQFLSKSCVEEHRRSYSSKYVCDHVDKQQIKKENVFNFQSKKYYQRNSNIINISPSMNANLLSRSLIYDLQERQYSDHCLGIEHEIDNCQRSLRKCNLPGDFCSVKCENSDDIHKKVCHINNINTPQNRTLPFGREKILNNDLIYMQQNRYKSGDCSNKEDPCKASTECEEEEETEEPDCGSKSKQPPKKSVCSKSNESKKLKQSAGKTVCPKPDKGTSKRKSVGSGECQNVTVTCPKRDKSRARAENGSTQCKTVKVTCRESESKVRQSRSSGDSSKCTDVNITCNKSRGASKPATDGKFTSVEVDCRKIAKSKGSTRDAGKSPSATQCAKDQKRNPCGKATKSSPRTIPGVCRAEEEEEICEENEGETNKCETPDECDKVTKGLRGCTAKCLVSRYPNEPAKPQKLEETCQEDEEDDCETESDSKQKPKSVVKVVDVMPDLRHLIDNDPQGEIEKFYGDNGYKNTDYYKFRQCAFYDVQIYMANKRLPPPNAFDYKKIKAAAAQRDKNKCKKKVEDEHDDDEC